MPTSLTQPAEPLVTAAELLREELPGPQRTRPRLVVGVDGSYGSGAALCWAARQARERQAVLDIVTVWDEAAQPPPGRGRRGEGQLELARERLERALAALARERNLPKRVITAPLHGLAGEQLVRRAAGAELLVLGTSGIGSPEIPGAIGLYCLRHSNAPVVFVPAPPG
ncbi:universal stress protein [Streptomyces sp. NPDC058964]|uniref:universal stress protein n=1 Tax=Streptomyces sp. NPDC058964 TaxID=3346681 RepID=UPI0036CBAE3F